MEWGYESLQYWKNYFQTRSFSTNLKSDRLLIFMRGYFLPNFMFLDLYDSQSQRLSRDYKDSHFYKQVGETNDEKTSYPSRQRCLSSFVRHRVIMKGQSWVTMIMMPVLILTGVSVTWEGEPYDAGNLFIIITEVVTALICKLEKSLLYIWAIPNYHILSTLPAKQEEP
jgi:hypothetical protein